ncbi:hypothetical protein [Pontibacter mangrovi]|uniref:Uncharacterized protein n=1 Tax=Pontibacter mangrovi TaxID=2589816 RepID=A0A501W484_9BACT|nr:hypothetical protein [Pontibacter mangrovi]TPE43592.1 hypothetical protein FJM65_12615 [Pontibacter mangrovi]
MTEPDLLKNIADVFLNGMDERVTRGLHFIKTKYKNTEMLNLCVSFMEYHHSDAIVADVENLFYRIGYFPATEAEMELDYSIKHALIGSYKAAFADLRRAIELTAINVYLTSEHSKREASFEWIMSQRDSPFFSTMIESLAKTGRFKDINEEANWKQNIKQFYWRISDYTHNKGQAKGYRELNKVNAHMFGTFVPNINLETLSSFLDCYIETVREITIFLALYNPVILVGLPLEDKFGLNGPMSGFYTEHQAEAINSLIPEPYKEYFTQLIKKDEEVIGAVESIISMPDLTKEDFDKQVQALKGYMGGNGEDDN